MAQKVSNEKIQLDAPMQSVGFEQPPAYTSTPSKTEIEEELQKVSFILSYLNIIGFGHLAVNNRNVHPIMMLKISVSREMVPNG